MRKINALVLYEISIYNGSGYNKPFTLANSVALGGDSTRQAVAWRGAQGPGGPLAVVAGRRVRLEFRWAKGSLFSFWSAPSACGASGGFLSSGAGLRRGRDAWGACNSSATMEPV